MNVEPQTSVNVDGVRCSDWEVSCGSVCPAAMVVVGEQWRTCAEQW